MSRDHLSEWIGFNTSIRHTNTSLLSVSLFIYIIDIGWQYIRPVPVSGVNIKKTWNAIWNPVDMHNEMVVKFIDGLSEEVYTRIELWWLQGKYEKMCVSFLYHLLLDQILEKIQSHSVNIQSFCLMKYKLNVPYHFFLTGNTVQQFL